MPQAQVLSYLKTMYLSTEIVISGDGCCVHPPNRGKMIEDGEVRPGGCICEPSSDIRCWWQFNQSKKGGKVHEIEQQLFKTL